MTLYFTFVCYLRTDGTCHPTTVYDTGYPNAIGVDMWTLLPYSRGSVQIESADSFQKPRVQVNWFKVDIDLKIHVAGAKLVRQLFRSGETG